MGLREPSRTNKDRMYKSTNGDKAPGSDTAVGDRHAETTTQKKTKTDRQMPTRAAPDSEAERACGAKTERKVKRASAHKPGQHMARQHFGAVTDYITTPPPCQRERGERGTRA